MLVRAFEPQTSRDRGKCSRQAGTGPNAYLCAHKTYNYLCPPTIILQLRTSICARTITQCACFAGTGDCAGRGYSYFSISTSSCFSTVRASMSIAALCSAVRRLLCRVVDGASTGYLHVQSWSAQEKDPGL